MPSWIGLTDENGVVRASTGGILEGQDVSTRNWYARGREAPWAGDVHDAVLLANLLPNPTGEPLRFVDIAAPVYEPGGEFKGVLCAHLSWAWAREIQATLDDAAGLDDIDMLIVGSDGTALLQPDGGYGPDPDGSYSRLDPPSLATVQTGRALSRVEDWPDGETCLTGVARGRGYLSYPGLGWTVVVRQSDRAAFASARALQREIMLSGLGVALGDRSADTAPELLHRADEAMYRAKQRGKACFEVDRPDTSAEVIPARAGS